MPTNSTEEKIIESDIEFTVTPFLECDSVCIVQSAYVDPSLIGILEKVKANYKDKKFYLLACCKEQLNNAKDNIFYILQICEGMKEDKQAVFRAVYIPFKQQFQDDDSDPDQLRTIH